MNTDISRAIKHRLVAKDVFYTPETVAKAHIATINTNSADIWYDPFKGSGSYYNNFPTTNKLWSEIAENKDFFKFDDKVDIICSNPPYSMIDDVLVKCIELKPRIISFLFLHGAMTPKRMEFMKANNYGLISMYACKVYRWYGMAEAYTFELNKDFNHCKIQWDRIVHRLTDLELKDQMNATEAIGAEHMKSTN